MKRFKTWFACAATALAMMGGAASANTSLPKEITINKVEFVLIPAGWFYKTAGQPMPGKEIEFHDEMGGGNVRLWLDDYYIAKYEARARDLVGYLNSPEGKAERYAGNFLSCSTRLGPDGKYMQLRAQEDLPATHLSWTLAERWARWMGFRLLSEPEWEKAARGADQRVYPWGDAYPDETFAGFKTRSDCFTWPVDSFLKGVSPYGIHNMAGNVREFIGDWYSIEHDKALKDGMRNPPSPARGSTREHPTDRWFAGPWKMLKGGRWASHEDQIRIGSRIYYLQDDSFRCNGTRFGLDVATVREHLAKGTAVVTKE